MTTEEAGDDGGGRRTRAGWLHPFRMSKTIERCRLFLGSCATIGPIGPDLTQRSRGHMGRRGRILERIPFEWNIAGGGEIVDAFLWREAREAIAEGPP